MSFTSVVPNAEAMHAGVVNAVDARLIEQVKRKQVRIAVIGMGHVGLPTALGFASLGWTVLGVDSSEPLISLIQAGKVPFYEPGLDELLKQQLGKNFFPVVDMDEAIRQATILFLCVGTPQKENGQADLSQVEAAARTIAHNLNGYKLIVEKSTVPAITAQWICRTIRRFATNGNSNAKSLDFDVASNPEFLQEGVALRNVSRPERIVCGVESARARRMLEEVYRPVPARVLITGTSTAEIITGRLRVSGGGGSNGSGVSSVWPSAATLKLSGSTLSQPLTPHASAMRPTSMASAGSAAASSPAGHWMAPAGRRAAMARLRRGRGLGGGLLEQALDGRGGLRAHAAPVRQAVLGDANAFLVVLGDRVVETQALDETAITTHALVGDDDVEERAALGAAAGESNDDHDLSYGW